MATSFAGLPLPIRIRPARPLSDEEIMQFCARNEDVNVEREATGELVVMTPAGYRTGKRNSALISALDGWAVADGRGIVFDSNTGFTLADGSLRSPDAAWLSHDRASTLTAEEMERYAPVCPEFVVELRSASDALAPLQAKMEQWIANGAEVGWLVDPIEKMVTVYRPGREPRQLIQPPLVEGEGPIVGFVLTLERIFA